MSRRDLRTPEERELDMRIEHANAVESRLDEHLTRREVVETFTDLAREYTNGPPESQRIADTLKAIAKALS